MSVSPQSSVSQSASELSISELRPCDFQSLTELVRSCTDAGLTGDAVSRVLDKAFAAYHVYVRNAVSSSSTSSDVSSDGGGSVSVVSNAKIGNASGARKKTKRVGRRGRSTVLNLSSCVGVGEVGTVSNRSNSSDADWRSTSKSVLPPNFGRANGASGTGFCYEKLFQPAALVDLGPYPSMFDIMSQPFSSLRSFEELAALRVSCVDGLCHVGDQGTHGCLDVLRVLAVSSCMPYLADDSVWACLQDPTVSLDASVSRVFPMEMSVGAEPAPFACVVGYETAAYQHEVRRYVRPLREANLVVRQPYGDRSAAWYWYSSLSAARFAFECLSSDARVYGGTDVLAVVDVHGAAVPGYTLADHVAVSSVREWIPVVEFGPVHVSFESTVYGTAGCASAVDFGRVARRLPQVYDSLVLESDVGACVSCSTRMPTDVEMRCADEVLRVAGYQPLSTMGSAAVYAWFPGRAESHI